MDMKVGFVVISLEIQSFVAQVTFKTLKNDHLPPITIVYGLRLNLPFSIYLSVELLNS